MSYLGYLHIKQILISQERSKIWKSCKELVQIISRILSNKSVFLQLNLSMYMHFKDQIQASLRWPQELPDAGGAGGMLAHGEIS